MDARVRAFDHDHRGERPASGRTTFCPYELFEFMDAHGDWQPIVKASREADVLTLYRNVRRTRVDVRGRTTRAFWKDGKRGRLTQ